MVLSNPYLSSHMSVGRSAYSPSFTLPLPIITQDVDSTVPIKADGKELAKKQATKLRPGVCLQFGDAAAYNVGTAAFSFRGPRNTLRQDAKLS
jgi:hypothetical protein